MINLDFGKDVSDVWIDQNDEVFVDSKWANFEFQVLITPITRRELIQYNLKATHATKGLDANVYNHLIFMEKCKDWKGFGFDGKIAPCNVANKEKLFDRYPKLATLISLCIVRDARVQEVKFEEEVKNLS